MHYLKENEKYKAYHQAIMDNFIGGRNWLQLRYEVEARGYNYPTVDILDELEVKQTALEIGCGYGSMSIYLKRLGWRDVIASDIHPYCSVPSLTSNGITFRTIDVISDPLPPQMDLIIFTEVLEHLVQNPKIAMKRMYDSLSPGGTIVLSTPSNKANWGLGVFQAVNKITSYKEIAGLSVDKSINPLDTHYYIYNTQEVEELLLEAGFTISSLEIVKVFRRHMFAVATKESSDA